MDTRSDEDLAERIRAAHGWRLLIHGRDATEHDRHAFEAWLAADPRNEEIYGRAETLWSALGEMSPADFDHRLHRPSSAERWSDIKIGIGTLVTRPSLRFVASGAVACAVVLGALSIGTQDISEPPAAIEQLQEANYTAAQGETQIVELSDGTQVTLGAASAIKTGYSETRRTAELIRGVAFFDVASDQGRPFQVNAEDLTITVTGTEFDVKLTNGEVRVAVAEGGVDVTYPITIDNEPTNLVNRRNLIAGQQITASNKDGISAAKSIGISTIGAWREDRLIYDGAPLAELVEDANRYATRRVVIDESDMEEISALRIRGAFSGRDIDGMLSSLALIHPVEIDRSDPERIQIRAVLEDSD
ncbi:MAG: FecR domain-containing protein [Pseudomonadota bacterium]